MLACLESNSSRMKLLALVDCRGKTPCPKNVQFRTAVASDENLLEEQCLI